MPTIEDPRLDRRIPPDWKHVETHPYAAAQICSVVEDLLTLPKWHKEHDQGKEGACTAFGWSMVMSIINDRECRLQGDPDPYCRYIPWPLWDAAKLIDPWDDTNPGDSNGTTVRAGGDILRDKGHWPWKDGMVMGGAYGDPIATAGIKENRWATSVDEVRTAISQGMPCAIGVSWYSSFYTPVQFNTEWWIGKTDLGYVRGEHCVCVYGASDLLQAVKIKNSWGESYPEVWLPYSVLDHLIRDGGEVALVTDK